MLHWQNASSSIAPMEAFGVSVVDVQKLKQTADTLLTRVGEVLHS